MALQQTLEIQFEEFGTDALFINHYGKNNTFLKNICRNEIKYITLHPQKIKTMSLTPIIKYRGGKSKEIPHIEAHIPNFTGRYIEPFFGGGALFFHLSPQQAIINDINTKLVNFYIGVRDHYEDVIAQLSSLQTIYEKNRAAFEALKVKHPNEHVEDANEELYYQMRNMYNDLIPHQYLDAVIYYFINKTAYSGMIRYNAKGEFNVPYGRYPHFNPNTISQAHSDLLRRTKIMNGDYKKVFELAQPNDFIFLDPPYDCVFSDYGNSEYKDGFGDEEHERLAADFRNLPCPALLVIGKTPLTERLYGDLVIDEYDKSYQVNIRNRFKSEAKHILVSNYGQFIKRN